MVVVALEAGGSMPSAIRSRSDVFALRDVAMDSKRNTAPIVAASPSASAAAAERLFDPATVYKKK